MARKPFELPDLGEGIAEADLLEWLVEPGDPVEEDQPIVEVETDKAIAQVPSPYDGTIAERRAEEGELIEVDEVFVVFEVDGETEPAAEPDDTDDAEPSPPDDGRVFAPPRVRRLAREEGIDIEALQAEQEGERLSEEDVLAFAEEEPSTTDATTSKPTPVESTSASAREKTLAMPATRRLAEEHGVDLDAVPASEEHDGHPFVTPEDVEAFVATSTEEAAGEAAPSIRSDEGPQPGERIPYRGIRRTIGEQMATSKFTAPHAGHHDMAEVSKLVEIRSELKEAADEAGVNLTYLPFAVKATVAALKAVPQLNATLDEEAEEIILHDEYHIGIAVAADAGLMVPVVENADQKGLLELAQDINDKAKRARDRSIDIDELSGSTFTITNVGPLGGEYVSPVVNYPEAGILAVGRIKERPWVEDGEVVAASTLPLSLSVDHRIVDGAEAAGFTNEVKRYLHNPHLLLLE